MAIRIPGTKYAVKVEKRLVVRREIPAIVSIASAIAGILLGGLIFITVGVSPVDVYSRIARIAASPTALMGAIEIALPIMFTSMALVLPFRMAFYNIGGEGQFELGAIAAMIPIIFYWSGVDLPQFLYLPIMFMLAFIAGGLWGLLPAFLRAKWRVNEILVTLMLNTISLQLIWWLTTPGGPWNEANPVFKERYLAYLKELGVHLIPGFKGTPVVPEFARLPRIPGTLVNSGILLAIIIAAILYFVCTKTLLGYEVRVVGDSERGAVYAGINYLKLVLIVMFISGGLAGLGGFIGITAFLPKLSPEIGIAGYGYAGIIVAWLARLNPIACLLVSFFFGILTKSADLLQQELKISRFIAVGFEGLIFILLVLGDFFVHYKVKLIKVKR
ncbi:MAG: hypothetical protein DRO23_02165 [Thermoprotei archaeon]|nr:MAG: hypothetical protein DRO23_02165 [Thermoprotei archaeon]